MYLIKNISAIFFFIAISLNAICQSQTFSLKEDISSQWREFKQNAYQPYTGEKDVRTIYFVIDAGKFSGDFLSVESANKFSFFVNGKLLSIAKGTKRFNIDSLSKSFGISRLLVGIHQKNIAGNSLHTRIETPVRAKVSKLQPVSKPSSFFRDFVVVASIILLIMLIIVLNLNPKLASDYFSVSRIFSVREADDSQIYMRITSSTNILFYVFCSLILGFYLMIVFHFISPAYSIVKYVHVKNFGEALWQWFLLSLIILAIFFFKVILVYIISNLFGSKELAGIHFFNWVRILLIIFGALSVFLYFYFILHGQSSHFHSVLLNLIAWSLIAWTIIIFLKLRGRSGYSMFHLFSYICATEIIPLLIIITVLYN